MIRPTPLHSTMSGNGAPLHCLALRRLCVFVHICRAALCARALKAAPKRVRLHGHRKPPATRHAPLARFNLVNIYASDSVPVVLCGTKVDLLCYEERTRLCARGNAIAAKAGAVHVQTSSKEGTGVRAAFELVAREVRVATARRGERGAAKRPTTGGGMALLSCSPVGCCMQMPWAHAEGGALRSVESPMQYA